jgi:hypothetical protein
VTARPERERAATLLDRPSPRARSILPAMETVTSVGLVANRPFELASWGYVRLIRGGSLASKLRRLGPDAQHRRCSGRSTPMRRSAASHALVKGRAG